jgi:hypothetical protein
MTEAMPDFEPAARQVGNRLTVRRALTLANRTVVWAALFAALSVLGARQVTPGESGGWAAALVLGLWGGGCAALSWWRRPDAYASLAHWDAVSTVSGSLASALWFRQKSRVAPGEVLHLREAGRILQNRLPGLKAEVPTGSVTRAWAWLLLLPILLGSGLGRRSLAWEDRPLTERMKEAATALAEDLAQVREKLEDPSEAKPEGLADPGKLEEILAGAQDLLANPGKATSGELLNALEDRARRVEKLSNEFRGEDDWLPAEVLQELERHADTAGLAGEIREKRPLGGAAEAERLAEMAGTPVADRLKQALEASLGKAGPDKAEAPVMRHLKSAETHLGTGETEQASVDFQELSDHFRGLARRQEAQEELQALAEQLRSGADELAGATREGNGEPAPAQAPPPGAEALAAQAPPAPSEGNATTPPPVAPGEAKSPSPTGNAAPLPGPPGAPVPGQANAPAPVPGTQSPPPSATLTLSAPVPGQAPPPGGAPQTLSAPVPGSPAPGAPGSTAGLQPGLNAGEGTAPLLPAPGKTMASTREDKVQAAMGTEGDSETRAVRSEQARAESAAREAKGGSANFTAVEESAMDEESLPAGRRDQVRRYFNALRQSLETEE